MNNNWWMVRAGRGGNLVQDFENEKCVAFGNERVEGLSQQATPDALREFVRNQLAELREGQIRMHAAQCHRWVFDIQVGDTVVTYDPDRRMYLIGTITSDVQPGTIGALKHIRKVDWTGQAQRDAFSVAAKNSLGSIMSIFSINADVALALQVAAHGDKQPTIAVETDETIDEIESLRLESEKRGREFIEDRVAALDWEDMQDLVAGILRAMGYKTRVSPRGPDRGKDIIASPDGLGLSNPRIIVEVKHRPNTQADANMIRSFLGGRRTGDNGMFVSTGGYTKDARYEAERATIPIALITLEELVDLLIQYYERCDTERAP